MTDPALLDEVVQSASRVVVLGSDIDLATVLTRLLRLDRLGVEVAHPSGRGAARRALSAGTQRIPLIRDETGRVLVGRARWQAAVEGEQLEGEGIVDDTVLFDGAVTGVQIEALPEMPGLRARVVGTGWRSGPWVSGRAAQLGTPGAIVVRDGVAASRPVRRSTFYRHIEGWLRVG
ncbi:MAG: hypothetical protein WBB07_03175 [Mycobacterium sp.]